MQHTKRRYTFLDTLIQGADALLRTLTMPSQHALQRPNPSATHQETVFDAKQCATTARLMRVNHVGEVCAQALYQGQALLARNKTIQQRLEHAALEEQDHLLWCEQRIHELHGRTSYLNPLWYVGSLTIGMMAGLAGDAISMGFLAETEWQVEQHLAKHLARIPTHDQKSHAILKQMRIDEISHAKTAEQAGAREFPHVVKFTMRCAAKVMTTVAYWI